MSDSGSLFGSSKSRSGASFSFLRGRRSGDAGGLISFNLLPQESAENAPSVPGRVSETRLLLVEYWRRDQRAAAAFDAEQVRLADTGIPFEPDLPVSSMLVNGAPVSAPPSIALPPPSALPPAASAPRPAPEPPVVAAQAPALDPNRPDFLSSLKSRQRSPMSSPAAPDASGPLVIDPSSSTFGPEPGEAPRAADHAASLFVEPDAMPAAAPPPERARSIFEPRPREAVAARAETESVFAHAAAEPPIVEHLGEEMGAGLVSESAEALVSEASEPPSHPDRQAKIHALESFLRRVEHRRQQIESQSVA